MNETITPPTQDDPRVISALEEYVTALESGRRLDRQQFLASHADLAPALAQCLDGLTFVHTVAPELQQPAGEPLADAPAPLGDYRIVREVGRGGMGVVYEAVQLSLGRRVALKVLPFAATLDTRQLQRFKNEAHAAAQLHHTNIVPVYAVGSERGVHYYAMQFIEGQSLAEVIRDLGRRGEPDAAQLTGSYVPASAGLVPPAPAAPVEAAQTPAVAALSTERSARSHAYYRRVADLGMQAADALEHAHQMGVVHRDVKPANLLLDAHGRLWVTDFGLAQFQSQASLTLTGDLVGTVRYMSPEQALAQRIIVDHRTDVYSLGATLYELLTLRPPFNGNDRHELLRQIAFDDPMSPRRLDRSVPFELETIVLKAMAKNPADRYATARDLVDDLRRFLDDKPILARRPSLVQRAAKWSRRHRSVVWSAAVVLVLAVLGLGLTTVLIADKQQRTNEALEERTEAVGQRDQALKELGAKHSLTEQALQRERDAKEALAKALEGEKKARADLTRALWRERRAVYAHGVTLALRYVLEKDYPQALALLYACPLEERCWEWHHVKRLCHPELWVFRGHEWRETLFKNETVYCVAYNPDGQHVASGGVAGLIICDAATGARLKSAAGMFTCAVAYSPDGQRIAWCSESRLVVADPATDKVLHTLEVNNGFEAKLTFTRDGKRLAWGGTGGSGGRRAKGKLAQVRVWDLENGQCIHTFDLQPGSVSDLAFSRDGTRLAAAVTARDGTSDVQVWDAEGQMVSARKWPDRVAGLAFGSTGKFLYVASGGLLERCHTGVLRKREVIHKTARAMVKMALSQDMKRFTLVLDNRSIEIMEFTKFGPSLFTLPCDVGAFTDLTLSPDGKRMATAHFDRTVRAWNVAQMTSGPDFSDLLTNKVVKGPLTPLVRLYVPPAKTWQLGADSKSVLEARDGAVQVRELVTGKVLRTLAMLGENAVVFAICPQERHIVFTDASPTDSHTVPLKVWDVKAGKVVHQFAGSTKITMSPDGRHLAVLDYGAPFLDLSVKILDTATGKQVFALPGNHTVCFSPDSKRIAALVYRNDLYPQWLDLELDHPVEVFDVETGKKVLTLAGRFGAMDPLVFSPDGTRLAGAETSLAAKGSVSVVWDAQTGRELFRMGGISEAAFSPDGRRLVTVSAKVTIRDAATGKEILTLPEKLQNLTFTPDGSWLVGVGPGGQLQVLDGTSVFDSPPYDPDVWNELAWSVVVHPDAKPAHIGRAVELAKKATVANPNESNYWNTLGVAHYRAGDWKQSALALEKSLALHGGDHGANHFFLAMARWRLGDQEAARKWYAQGVKWLEKSVPVDEEMVRFQAEAAEVLGLDRP
jgi:serine/threonine protein kinase/WD40 repeat protein